MLDRVARKPKRATEPVDWLVWTYEIGREIVETTSILRRLRNAQQIQAGQEPDRYWHDSLDDDEGDYFVGADIRSAKEIAANLAPDEISRIRATWEAEVARFGGILFAGHGETARLRHARLQAIDLLHRLADRHPKLSLNAKATQVAEAVGYSGGPRSLQRLLKNPQARGGIYEIDELLFYPEERYHPPPKPSISKKKSPRRT